MTPPAAPNRRFLERSIADLDRELAAGDLDPADHARLRAEYERRLRGEGPPPRPPARPGFVAAGVVFVLVVAIGAGILVAQSVGRREDGGNITGGGPSAAEPAGTAQPAAPDLPEELLRCRELEGGEAIDCYTAYTEANPGDAAGFVEFGLFAVQAGLANDRDELFDAGETFLRRALELDPGHLEARVYLAVLLDRTGRAEEAAAECARLAGLDVPAGYDQLLDLACSTD